MEKYEIGYKDIIYTLPPLNFSNTKEIPLKTEIVGQEKAIDAIKVALSIRHSHYNLFVSGLPGTGRNTSVRHILSKMKKKTKLFDRCYVYNFSSPDTPILLTFKAGYGKRFKRDFENLAMSTIEFISNFLRSEAVAELRKLIFDKYKKNETKLFEELQKMAEPLNFKVVFLKIESYFRPVLKPVYKGQVVEYSDLEKLRAEGKISEDEYLKIEENFSKLSFELEKVLINVNELGRRAYEELDEGIKNIILPIIETKIKPLKDIYRDKKVHKFFDDFKNDILENIKKIEEEKEQFPSKYRVNLIIDNSNFKTTPIVFENSPTFQKLFGTIEFFSDSEGVFKTDFTMIKGGSLLKADGGYLVLNAYDLLTHPGVWEKLKRTLRSGELEIQPREDNIYLTSGLRPEPINVDVKVILIGEPWIYDLLYELDPEFNELFRVRADFDNTMDLNKESASQYAYVIKKVIEGENLLTMRKDGIEKVIEYGMRIAERKDKVSTEFTKVADIIREANHFAKERNGKFINAEDVEKAIEKKYFRSNLFEEKINEMIKNNEIMIDTEGEKIGQINGLEVYSIGDLSFGKPVKITANVSCGKIGVVNIEREVELSGPIHSKGVIIITGYLQEKLAQDYPLSLNGYICFEQSYTGIDGDSASAAELIALLSALTDIPLKQYIAITGSINQKGEIQPIGSVNEKIEGFYYVCSKKGLTGNQGVIIPYQNIKNLVLKNGVLKAIKEKRFHLYAIKNIEEGIEILTGLKSEEVFKKAKEKVEKYANSLKKLT
uniref:endopeptidase La n=1 Tax=candidate division WOR-3 bacterium TaxID=2052148 RepID=A0A7C4U899_UNCW3